MMAASATISAVPVAPVAAAGTATVGISPSIDPDVILVTTQKAGLSLRKLSEQHVVNSMSLPATRSFQCPAVQHSDTGHVYAAVSSPCELRQWNNMTESFSQGASLSLSEDEESGSNVHSLHTASSVDGVIAIYNNGTARRYLPESFSQIAGKSTPYKRKEKRPKATPSGKRKQGSDGISIGDGSAATNTIWAHVLTEQKSGVVRIVVVAACHDTGTCRISVQKVDAESGALIPQQSRVLDVPDTIVCVTCAFQWPDTLLSLWSDGSLRRTCIGKGAELLDLSLADNDTTATTLPADILTVFACFGGLPHDGSKKGKAKSADKLAAGSATVSIEAITPTLVLIAGASAASSQHLVAVLWNTTFSTVHAHASFGDDVTDGVAWTRSDTMRGVVHKGLGSAILATSSRVFALNFPGAVETCTLAGAMNTMVAARAVVSPAWLESATKPVTAFTPAWSIEATSLTTATISHRNSAIADALRDVLDSSKTASEKSLLAALKRYFATVDEGGRTSKKPKLETTPGDCDAPLVGATHHDLEQIMQRCLDEKRFFPAQVMTLLLRQRILSLEHCPTLLDVAVSSHHRGLMHACFSLLNGISEATALSYFSVLFRGFVDGLRKGSSVPGTSTSDGSESELEEFLRLLFAHGWNEGALTAATGALSLEETVHLLDSLQWWLHLYANTADVRTVADKYTGPVPTQAQILDWLCTVVDAKFATLIHSSETHDSIKRISALLMNHAEECDSMKGVRGLISHILEKKPIARPHAEIGPYSIEIVTL
eukprot:m.453836 g.453836  ORF g.453836 m.453836 type:complete len:773 (-) comp21557_c0_seq1:90-2408(-)